MIARNLNRIRNDLEEICKRTGRNFEEITIVAVTKYVNTDEIKEAIGCGIKDFAENKVQDALLKFKGLKENANLHMIGHLQTNKVKKAAGLFDIIQSVDSIRLAKEIDKYSKVINKVMNILVQVNTSGEAVKFGVGIDETIDFVRKIKELPNIKIKGLMTIGPLVSNPEETRLCFRKLKHLFDELNYKIFKNAEDRLTILSMGMSDDYKTAVEEGSTMLRIGRALFKEEI